jgi:hypothetical protein
MKMNAEKQDLPFCKYRERDIDDSTIIDLLGVVIYEASRASALSEIGFKDQASTTFFVLDFVLDALGVPPSGKVKVISGERKEFSKAYEYSRERFYEITFGDYAIEFGEDQLPANKLLDSLKDEMMNFESHYK